VSLNACPSGRARRPAKNRATNASNPPMPLVPSVCVAFSITRRVRRLRYRHASHWKQFVAGLYTRPDMGTARILVVDDDRVVREMLAQYLSEHGYEVALAD